MTVKNNLIEKLKNKKANIGIVGLGYVGLPLAIEYIRAGYFVTGFDIDKSKVESLKKDIEALERKKEFKRRENSLLRDKRLYLTKSSAGAFEQKEKLVPLGWIGIFFFVMAPLPVTGPVVGSIIGYMLKLSIVRNFSATFMGTLTAIIVWFYCFDFLEQRFHMIQYLFGAIVIIVLLPYMKTIKDFFMSSPGGESN